MLNHPFVWKNPSASPPKIPVQAPMACISISPLTFSDSPEASDYSPIFRPKPKAKRAEEPKKFRDSCTAYKAALEKRGFKYLGSGAYSTVMGKPGSDKVIKIGRRPKDDGWWDYMTWAKNAGYMGKWAPIVYSYKYHRGKSYDQSNAFYVAVVERLDKTMGALNRDNSNRLVQELFQWKTEHGNEKAGEVMDQFIPGLNTFATAFRKEFDGVASMDLHGGNFMCRKDGSFVLVDPLCSPKIIYKKRMKAAPKAAVCG